MQNNIISFIVVQLKVVNLSIIFSVFYKIYVRKYKLNNLKSLCFLDVYRKPTTIRPGLIYFRKRFLMGLYKGGGAYIRGGGLIHGRSFVLAINKSDINKSVINRKINMF